MNRLLKFCGAILLLLIASNTNAQEYKFKYQRSLEGIADTWHQIMIPTDAYDKLNKDFSDVRIIGILANGDTIEAPYILKVQADVYDNKTIDFNLINNVKSQKGYFYTFELAKNQLVNYINLSFNRPNFDWFVTLEGSQNQQEWFTVLDKYRIVSIENENTSYSYTTLNFKNVNYKYLRVKVPSKKNPRFERATIEEKKVIFGKHNAPQIFLFDVTENEDLKETEILISLKNVLPISFLRLVIQDSIDYYRPVIVEYANDSIEDNKGWHYLYKTLFHSTLSTLNTEGYNFPNTVLKHLRIRIDNNDNEPLNYSDVKLHGNTHSLITRFTKPATYYLVYGNSLAYVPNYDITRFEDNIPTNNKRLSMGDEIFIEEPVEVEQEALFKDEIWLWAIMIFVIFILGWFSLRMLKN